MAKIRGFRPNFLMFKPVILVFVYFRHFQKVLKVKGRLQSYFVFVSAEIDFQPRPIVSNRRHCSPAKGPAMGANQKVHFLDNFVLFSQCDGSHKNQYLIHSLRLS